MKITKILVNSLFCFSILLLTSTSFSQGPQQTSSLKKPLIYQIGQVVHINAGGPRPLLQAIDALQDKYGWAVDYEDPQYPPSPAGVPSPPSPPNRRHANVSGVGESAFAVQFNAPPNGQPDEQSVLTTVVDSYNQSGGAAEFKLLKQDDGTFAVVGTRVPGSNNENQQPILDSPINLPTDRRTAHATIALICQTLSQQSEVPVTATSANVNETLRVIVGGNAVPARVLLARTLQSIGGKPYWRLIYNPDRKSYELTIANLSQ